MNSDSGWVKGSWGKRGHAQTPSNVTRISRAIKEEDSEHHSQIGRYSFKSTGPKHLTRGQSTIKPVLAVALGCTTTLSVVVLV